MERIFYPSSRRVFLFFYAPILLIWGILLIEDLIFRIIRPEQVGGNWKNLVMFSVTWVAVQLLVNGLRGKRFAIKITPDAIHGPITFGSIQPIPFDDIDYRRTFNPGLLAKISMGKHVYSLSGDELALSEYLFEPRQRAEIWSVIKAAHRQREAAQSIQGWPAPARQ